MDYRPKTGQSTDFTAFLREKFTEKHGDSFENAKVLEYSNVNEKSQTTTILNGDVTGDVNATLKSSQIDTTTKVATPVDVNNNNLVLEEIQSVIIAAKETDINNNNNNNDIAQDLESKSIQHGTSKTTVQSSTINEIEINENDTTRNGNNNKYSDDFMNQLKKQISQRGLETETNQSNQNSKQIDEMSNDEVVTTENNKSEQNYDYGDDSHNNNNDYNRQSTKQFDTEKLNDKSVDNQCKLPTNSEDATLNIIEQNGHININNNNDDNNDNVDDDNNDDYLKNDQNKDINDDDNRQDNHNNNNNNIEQSITVENNNHHSHNNAEIKVKVTPEDVIINNNDSDENTKMMNQSSVKQFNDNDSLKTKTISSTTSIAAATNEQNSSKLNFASVVDETINHRSINGGDDGESEDNRTTISNKNNNKVQYDRSKSMAPGVFRRAESTSNIRPPELFRSISNHNVAFTLEASKEEPKITRSRVNRMSQFWKNKIIVAKKQTDL